jgi:hypothetical protein
MATRLPTSAQVGASTHAPVSSSRHSTGTTSPSANGVAVSQAGPVSSPPQPGRGRPRVPVPVRTRRCPSHACHQQEQDDRYRGHIQNGRDGTATGVVRGSGAGGGGGPRSSGNSPVRCPCREHTGHVYMHVHAVRMRLSVRLSV